MQPVFIAVGTFTVYLGIYLSRAAFALISDTFQNRSTNKRRLAAEHAGNIELSTRLRQTYIDLSLSRRQTTWKKVLVAKVVKESEDVRSFYLVDENFEPLPVALPGQHILVECKNQTDASRRCRCYSLSDDGQSGHWRISVKKNSDLTHSASRWLHEDVSAGDSLRVRGPSGSFYLQSAEHRNIVLVCAGIGITPMLPMLMEAIRRPCRSIHFFAQFRDVAHMPFADSLSELASKYGQLSMKLWISRFPKGVQRTANSLFFEGKFNANDLLAHQGAFTDTDFYVCGPEDWQERIRNDLISAGVKSESIRYELFQPSERPVPKRDEVVQHKIHFKQSGANARFEPNQSSLLVCAGQNNVSLESGCRTGACGSCAVRLLRGKVRYTREPQFHMNSSDILPCVCVPESDIEVDA